MTNLGNSLEQAEKNARLRDINNEKKPQELAESLIKQLEALTGKKYFVAEEKDIFSGEPFNQVMHSNLDLLIQIDYLTQAEESFLFRIQPYLEFKSNVIICREDKFKRKKKKTIDVEDNFELPKHATVSDIAEMIGKSRQKTSAIMNSLRKKEILLNPQGAGRVIENGRTVSPRVWVVNPYILICAPRKNSVKLDSLTMHLFKDSLRDLKDKNGKKVKLPVRFF
jgi:hypothetical protein